MLFYIYINKDLIYMKKTILISLIAALTTTTQADNFIIKLDNKHYDNNITIQTEESSNNAPTNLSSCKELMDGGHSSGDGVYTVTLNSGIIDVFCDMTTDGGGWTLVSHIYDKDSRDDILNDSNGAAWGDSAVSPTHDSSFNIANSDTPSYTESKYDWNFPMYGDNYSHSGDATLINNRFNWGSGGSTTLLSNLSGLGVNNVAEDGRISGVFGSSAFSENTINVLNTNHSCAGSLTTNKSLHYWGFGSLIAYGNDSTYELHNNRSGVNRAVNSSCGTRNSILNIWVK
jgi:hypothetical protein